MKEFSKKEKEDLIVKQLRRQSSMKRILVSDAIASLMVIHCRNQEMVKSEFFIPDWFLLIDESLTLIN